MKYEYCCKCDCATGKAGAGDDSLYTETDGPFCEDCFPEFKSKQEQDEPVACVGARHYGRLTLIPRYSDQTFELEQPLYTAPQQRKPLTDEEFLELLLRKGSRDIVAYTTFVGGSIQMQWKIGLLKSAKVIKEFIEECYGIKE